MPNRRFRRLELDEGKASDATPEGPTDICRRCGAEHAEGTPTCSRCGGVLGGAGQDAFDAAHRARREVLGRRAAAAQPADRHSTVSDDPGKPPAPPRARARLAPGSAADLLAAGALLACIFALVSIPVRLVFSAAARQAAPLQGFVEIGIVVVVTLLVRRAAGRALDGR